jgi:transposase-like protein
MIKLLDLRKISSNNGCERANAEIKIRIRVAQVFPAIDSYMRLLVSYKMEV